MTGRSVDLVLLPGLDGTGKLFNSLIDSLPDWINPIVVAYPVDKECGYDELGKIVSAALPTNNDYVVLGESFSGPLAVMCAAGKPRGLQGIVLCATFVKKPFVFVPSWLSHLSVGPIYRLWPATIRLRAMFRGDKFNSLVDSALAAIKTVRPSVIAARVKALLNVNVENDLRQVDVPILYLLGRQDHLIRRHNCTGIKHLRPDMSVAEIDTQHFVLQLEPGASSAAIGQFIETKCVV